MATKKCSNGHKYDSSIYGNNCPFCPNSGDETIGHDDFDGGETIVTGGYDDSSTASTKEYDFGYGGEEETVVIGIEDTGKEAPQKNHGRRLAGLLISYSATPTGEVFNVYEGITIIGRDHTCTIPFVKDKHMTREHLKLQCIQGEVTAVDMGSANGTYIGENVDGKLVVKMYKMGQYFELHANDVIVLGNTKLLFLAIPKFYKEII